MSEDQSNAMRDALFELIECAILRGDCDLPHPSDDPKMWTARMQEAWDSARALVDGPEMHAAVEASLRLQS